ncbi:Helicase associated domain protein [Akkermansiaceae bacterium]|nr:Helicase associated domain protein [Akkermansiaceae bacterium]
MSAELFDEEAVNLPLAEAIQRNILPAPEYVASLYTLNEEVDQRLDNLSKSALSEDEKKKVRAELEQAKIDWEKTSGVPQILKRYLSKNPTNKFIVFCRNKEHLDELEDEVRKWIRKTKLFEDRETYRVYSDYKKSDANFEAFKNAKDKTTAHILLCIDKLNEGIHAPDVGAVLLFRPTASARIFYQQIGRCLQVGTKSKPIIFDLVNNFKSIKGANRFLDDLKEAGKKEKQLRENFGLDVDYSPEIHIDDESLAIHETLKGIDERLASWEINFQKLVVYREKYGDCLVPHDWEDKVLATWIITQRSFKARGKLDDNRIEQLEDIDFTWDARQAKWEANFKKLTAYKEEHGDCLVPRNWHDKKLATWVGTQRDFKNRDKLEDEKFRLLDNLGFVWDASRASSRLSSFELNYQKLVDYEKENKDCLVRSSYKDKSLVNWVTIQRSKKRNGELKSKEIERLDKLGFVWDPIHEEWEFQFQKLLDYEEQYGDCLVPHNWHDKKLAIWVGTQRGSKNKGKLEDEKIKRLDQLGFTWKTRLDWDASFQKLLDFKKENGHCLVPKNWKDAHLKNWVINQRRRKKRKVLAIDRVEKLEAVGFVWHLIVDRDTTWNRNFKNLLAYKKKHGDCLVPYTWQPDPTLGKWVTQQRNAKKQRKLDTKKIKRLDDLGFVWNPLDKAWEENLQKLIAYEKEHGNCLVPSKGKYRHLANWVGHQRKAKKNGNLDSTKIKRLKDLGFVWNALNDVWVENLQKLIAYKKEHGNCLVPNIWQPDPELGKWVRNQRQAERKGKLDTRRIKQLNEIDFVWDALQAAWEINLQKLTAYKKEHGSCLVPQASEEKQLGKWVGQQRIAKKEGKLDNKKIKQLTELGFVWDARQAAWESMFQKLVAYQKTNGDCLIPPHHEDEQLRNWVLRQRRFKKQGRMSADREERLNELGFFWERQK